MIPVLDIESLDLNKSGIIEASAGTGKTYTICTIVSKIIREGRAEADQIAVVTFTEKAAGELKQRIVKRLEEDLDKSIDDKETQYLKNALARTDEISIGTIHGFCNGLLHEFSFENGSPFKLNPNTDPELRKRLLNLQIRRDWQKYYGDFLPTLLKISNFIHDPNNFIDDVIKISNKLYAFVDCGNRPENDPLSVSYKIVPEVQTTENLKVLFAELENSIETIKELLPSANNEANNNIYKENGKKLHGNTINAVKRKFSSMIDECKKEIHEMDLKSFSGFLDQYEEKLASCDEIGETQTCSVQKEIRHFLESHKLFANTLKINTAVQLVKDFRKHKAESGTIDFDDMLVLVYEALQNKNGGENLFCRELQNKFRYALLDEFQDTDQVQWGIFKTIFLDKTSVNNKIYLIGDPKQAIYSFRNADINTYNQAKNEVIAAGGLLYNLGKNYRSVKNVVTGFNDLFTTKFFGKNGEITYTDVDYQSEDEQKIAITQSKENAICYLTSESKPDGDYGELIENFIVKEIIRLENEIKFKEKNVVRPLNLGDICILTRTNDDTHTVKKVLQRAGIPAEIYKETGVFRSDEALNLQCIFDALMFVNDEGRLKKALLSEFYDYTPAELENLTFDELWQKSKLDSLQNIIQRMDWSSFFVELFNCTEIFTRLLAKDTTKHKNIASRKITNYRHIAEALQENAYREKLNLEGMQKYLDSLRFLSDMDFFRKSGSQPMVQIMTIHASKGLEFPIVFILSCKLKNFKREKEPAFRAYHQDDKLVIDIVCNKESPAYELYKEENINEHNRLLYVAITRASCKLYLPLNYEALEVPDNVQKINLDEIPQDFVSRKKTDEVQENISKEFMNIQPDEMERFFRLESFSSLSAKNEHIEQLEPLFALDNDDDKEEDEVEIQADAVHAILPGGTKTGNMVHKIFEIIDFTAIADKERMQKEQIVTSLVSGETEESKIIFNTISFYYPNITPAELGIYANEVASIIYNTLNTPLSTPDAGSFCLCEIPKSDRISEMNFYMAVPNKEDLQMTGSLDLVFRYKGKYYFLDWKTNFLENYAKTAEYTEVHYGMQYKIYLQALKKFLSSRLKNNFQFERDFGGIFYLYVRGIIPDNPKQGVWFYKPQH